MSRPAVLALGLLLAGTAHAQPARTLVSAPSATVVSGDRLQLTALVVDANDRPVPGAKVNWRSARPERATVDADGVVRGLEVGEVSIGADAGSPSTSAGVSLLVVPAKVEVIPAKPELYVGDRLTFSVRALDRAGKPIPNVRVGWQSLGGYGMGTIDGEGHFTAYTVGTDGVRAILLDMLNPYGLTFTVETTIQVRPRPSYQVTRRLGSDDVRHSFLLRRMEGQVSVNEAGQIAFGANLDGLADALLVWDRGTFRSVYDASQPLPTANQRFSFGNGVFADPVIDGSGAVLVSDREGIFLAGASGFSPAVLSGISVADADSVRVCCQQPRRNGRGDLVFQAQFQYRGLDDNYNGLFRVKNGRPEMLVSQATAPEDDPDFSMNQIAIDSASTVYVATGGERQRLYRYGTALERIVGSGDAYEGTTVSGIGRFDVTEDGRLAYSLYLADGTSRLVLRLPGGEVRTRVTENPNVLDLAAGGVLFSGGSGGGSLQVWSGDIVRTVQSLPALAPNGEPIRWIVSAALLADGDVIAQVELAETGTAVLRLGAQPSFLFGVGSTVHVTAGLSIGSYGAVARGPGSAIHLLLGGRSRSLFELTPEGLVPRLLVGDTLPAGERVSSVASAVHGAGTTWVISHDDRLYKLDGARLEPAFPADGDARIGSALAVNSRGMVAGVGRKSISDPPAILLHDGSGWRVIATLSEHGVPGTPSPAGGVFESVRNLAIDEAGRVMAVLDRPGGGGQDFVLYDGQKWIAPRPPLTTQLYPGDTVVADGSRFLTTFNEGGTCNSFVAEYRSGDAWTIAVPADVLLPTGNRQVCSYGGIDISASGDLLLPAHAGSQDILMVRKADEFQLVAGADSASFEALPFGFGNGEFAFGPAGSVLFVSRLVDGSTVLFEARPVSGGASNPAPVSPVSSQAATLELESPRRWVYAGATLRLTATARDASGVDVAAPLTWTSSSPKVAAVSPDGTVTGLRPGLAVVTVRSGGRSAFTRLEVHPLRVEITPEATELTAGSDLPLAARAVDALGRTIPGLPITFESSSPGVATVNAQGLLHGVGAGTATVTARLAGAGVSTAFAASAPVSVRPRPDFLEAPALSGDGDPSPTLRRVEGVEAAGEGVWAIQEVLATGTRRVRLLDAQGSRTLATTGTALTTPEGLSSVIEYISIVRANLRGDVFAYLSTVDGARPTLFPASGAPVSVTPPRPYHGWVQDVSLNEAGDLLMVAGRDNGQDVLLRRGSALVTVVRQGDTMPGLGVLDRFDSVKLLENGTVAFQAVSGADNAVFTWDGTSTRRLCGSGDVGLLPAPLQWCALPTGRLSSTEVFVHGHATDGSNGIFRYGAGGARSNVLVPGQLAGFGLEVENVWSLYAVRGTTALVAVGTNRGGLYGQVDGGRFEPLGAIGDRVDEWRQVMNGALAATTVAFLGIGGTGRPQLMQVYPRESPLAFAGQSLPGPAATALESRPLAPIGRTQDALFFAVGRDVAGRLSGGLFQPVLGIGDALPEARTWMWTQGVETARDGSVALVLGTEGGQTVYRWRSGAYNAVADQNRTTLPGGGSINSFCCWQVAANSAGEVISNAQWSASDGSPRGGLLLFRDGSSSAEVVVQDGTELPGGGHAAGSNGSTLALDDAGRVATVSYHSEGGATLVLWERGKPLVALARTGEAGPGGRSLETVHRVVAAGGRLYAMLQYGTWGPNGQQPVWELAEIGPGGKRVIASGVLQPDMLSANAQGDVVYHRAEESADGIFVTRRDGTTVEVTSVRRKSASGIWWLDLFGAAISDDGDVWFTARTLQGGTNRIGLYKSRPLR